jgi:hypothetical protein
VHRYDIGIRRPCSMLHPLYVAAVLYFTPVPPPWYHCCYDVNYHEPWSGQHVGLAVWLMRLCWLSANRSCRCNFSMLLHPSTASPPRFKNRSPTTKAHARSFVALPRFNSSSTTATFSNAFCALSRIHGHLPHVASCAAVCPSWSQSYGALSSLGLS